MSSVAPSTETIIFLGNRKCKVNNQLKCVLRQLVVGFLIMSWKRKSVHVHYSASRWMKSTQPLQHNTNFLLSGFSAESTDHLDEWIKQYCQSSIAVLLWLYSILFIFSLVSAWKKCQAVRASWGLSPCSCYLGKYMCLFLYFKRLHLIKYIDQNQHKFNGLM